MNPVKTLHTLACIIVIGTALVGDAYAHITANPNEGTANGWIRIALRVSHGCEGSPTIAVQVKLPDDVISVKPQMKPGWTIEIKMRNLEHPFQGPHSIVTEVVDEIIWRGGPLPDSYFDEFGLSMKLPDAPGKILYFPTVQECETGTNRWVEIPAQNESWSDKDKPAPYVTLKESEAHNHSKH